MTTATMWQQIHVTPRSSGAFYYQKQEKKHVNRKVMSPDGGEEIHSGLSVGFNPNQQSIAVSGMDQNVFLKQGEVAYVMNANGKTISRYEHSVQQ